VKKVVALAATAIAALLAACGGGDSPEEVTVKGLEYAYEMPAKVDGGLTTMTFANTGGLPHEFSLGKLGAGKTEKDVKDFVAKGDGGEPPSWLTDVGGVSGLSPGTEIGITRNLAPGNYAFICFLPTSKGELHAKLGMIKGFTVGEDAGAKPPKADSTITVTDGAYEIPPLKGGQQTIELKNSGKKPHGFNLLTLEAGKTVDDIDSWFESGLKGKPPATLYGTVQQVPPGESNYLDIDLKSGVEYLMLDEGNLQKTFTVE
jgi:hypothetical protein